MKRMIVLVGLLMVLSISGWAVLAQSSAPGMSSSSNTGIGVQGRSVSGAGVQGVSDSGFGVHGYSPNGPAVFGHTISSTGVTGSSETGMGVQGTSNSNAGVFGKSISGGVGVAGESNSGTGVSGKSITGWAGWFDGKVQVIGNAFVTNDLQVWGRLTKASGSFKIDHPLDPANKTLSHSFVESPDMMNIYNGNVVLDAKGEAIVELDKWFEALNKDFRYQLTSIAAPGPNLYIAEEIKNNRFKIAGGKPGAKVSWQVTGVRQDAYANKNRIKVEEDKPAAERGTYLHPGAFGQPPGRGTARVQHRDKGKD